jgi:hypothetical protein
MSEKTGHTSRVDRERIQHQLLQCLQVHTATQGREIKEAKGRFRQTVLRAILTTYRADITQYAGKDQVLVKRVFDAIPSELAKEDKRFILADLEKGASRRKYEDPTQWLIDARKTGCCTCCYI